MQTDRESPLLSSSKTACVRCRGQKLRCSKHVPSCIRCTKQRASCIYPAEADRKRLAALRKASNARNTEDQLIDPQSPDSTKKGRRSEPFAFGKISGVPGLPIRSSNGSDSMQSNGLAATEPIAIDGDALDELPPRALGLSLLEIYFERIYNAPLLFNKQSLITMYLQGQLPDYLLRALFALAYIFLETNQSRSNGPLELNALALFSSRGRPWAESASREALSLSGRPSLHIIQTLESLTIYWFASGDNQRADIHLTVAYRSCYNVNYNKLRGSAVDSCKTLMTEMERRCLWACWATMCIAGQPKAYVKSAWLEAAELPLPLSFDLDGSVLCPSHAMKMDADWNCSFVEEASLDRGLPECVLTAEVLKMIGIWSKTQVLIKQTTGDTCLEIVNLSSHATTLYKSPIFPPSPGASNDTSATKEQILLLHSLYHLCQMTLNRTLVPRLCGRQHTQVVSAYVERKCAQTVLEHARMQGQLIVDHLVQSSDVTTISPIVGYASFSAAVIFALSARSQDLRTTPSTLSNDEISMKSLIGLVDQLSYYWKPLQRLSTKLHTVMARLLPSDCYGSGLGIRLVSIADPDALSRDPPSIETEHSVISSGYVYTSESETEECPATPMRTVNKPNGSEASTRHGHTNASDELESSSLFNDTWQSADILDGWEGFTGFVTSDADIEGLETLTALFPSEWPLY